MKVAIGLFVVFLVAAQGCGPTQVLYKPNVGQAQIDTDKQQCADQARFYTGGGPLFGSRRSTADQYFDDCMTSKGYKWVIEKDIPKQNGR
jgi:hypothetical protein